MSEQHRMKGQSLSRWGSGLTHLKLFLLDECRNPNSQASILNSCISYIAYVQAGVLYVYSGNNKNRSTEVHMYKQDPCIAWYYLNCGRIIIVTFGVMNFIHSTGGSNTIEMDERAKKQLEVSRTLPSMFPFTLSFMPTAWVRKDCYISVVPSDATTAFYVLSAHDIL